MTLFVSGLEVVDGEFRVVLQGVEGFMSEHFLDVVHVRPAPDQLGRATPPERVRRDVYILEPGLVDAVMHDAE